MSEYTHYRGAIYHCIESNGVLEPNYFVDGLMVVDNDSGSIIEVGNFNQIFSKWPNAKSSTHFKDSLIMPGFIDTHVHYPQYKVIASYGASLIDWLNKYTFIEEQKFSDEVYASKVADLFLDELIKNGTTTAMTFCTSHKQSVDIFFTAAEKLKLRMVAGKVMMDRNAPEALCDSVDASYFDSKELIEKWHNRGRMSYAVTPRFAPTSSSEQLVQAAKLLEEYSDNNGNEGVLLQTHLNENIDEIGWVKELFPDSKNYFDVYDNFNLSGPNSVFGHCIYNTDEEYKRIADSGSKVALCPRSNLFLGSGLFELDKLETFGIGTALASDVGGGDSFSMFQVMNEAYKICRLNNYNLDPVKAFYLTTLAAAKVLNMDNRIGNFEPNKEADFIVIDLKATELIKNKLETSDDINDILFNLMTLGDDRLIKEVYILGQNIYQK